MVNGSVISDIVNNTSKQTPNSKDKTTQSSVLDNKSSSLKQEDLSSNFFSLVVISLLVLVILIGISIISYLKTK